MPDSDNPQLIDIRRKILALKDAVVELGPDVYDFDPYAAHSLRRARAALFEAWTLLVGPPVEDEDDH